MNFHMIAAEAWSPVYAQIDLKQTTLKIKDGTTPTPNEVEIKIGEGNFTFTEARNIEYTLDRGLLDEVREGDQIPMDVSFDFVWEYISGPAGSGELPTIHDILTQEGNAASWISSDLSDPCAPFALDLEIDYSPVCTGFTGDKEIITIADFRWEQMDFDLRNATVAVSGRANVTRANYNRFNPSS
jgi:hypothetical protein